LKSGNWASVGVPLLPTFTVADVVDGFDMFTVRPVPDNENPVRLAVAQRVPPEALQVTEPPDPKSIPLEVDPVEVNLPVVRPAVELRVIVPDDSVVETHDSGPDNVYVDVPINERAGKTDVFDVIVIGDVAAKTKLAVLAQVVPDVTLTLPKIFNVFADEVIKETAPDDTVKFKQLFVPIRSTVKVPEKNTLSAAVGADSGTDPLTSQFVFTLHRVFVAPVQL